MAKDLPYFKFFCSEWNDGDITLEDYKTQGIFINLCSFYWSRSCDVDFKKIYKKYKGCENEIDKLVDAEIIYNCDGKLCINFLDEQLEERDKLSKQNARNAKKRYEKPASAQVSQSDNGAIKKREEKKREDNIEIDNTKFASSLKTDTIWLESVAMKNKISLDSVSEKLSIFDLHLTTIKKQHNNKREYTSHFMNWLSMNKTNNRKKLTF